MPDKRIEIARLTLELVKICNAHPTADRYQGVGYGINIAAPPIEAFNVIYRYLSEKLADEREKEGRRGYPE